MFECVTNMAAVRNEFNIVGRGMDTFSLQLLIYAVMGLDMVIGAYGC
jgi:hypothetical protein